ncbi:MAG: TIGR04211 family SH3 domain-containing protein [Pseudomonadota bacterium]
MLRLSVACCLCLLAAMAHAENEVRYITNKLYLTLTDQPDGAGAKLKTLTSGDAVTILESGATFAKVQTTDGIVGWLKASYLVTEAPGEQRAGESSDEEKVRLGKKIEELTKQNNDLAQQNGELKHKLDETTRMLEASKDQLSRRETNDVKAEKDTQQDSTHPTQPATEFRHEATVISNQPLPTGAPLLPMLIASIIALTIGLISGAWWIDRKVKKRFSGHRVY